MSTVTSQNQTAPVVRQYEIGGVRYIVKATVKDGAKETAVKKIRRLSGILTSSEIVSADRYSLFVGVLKKRFVWILLGILICQAVFARILFYAGAVYLAFTSAIAVCVLTMHAGIYGILRFFGLVFPQGFFYTLAAYLLWIMVVEQADGKEKIRLWMMVFFMVLGIISEIFINPNFSALIFQLF